jgi:hypothetical protein
VSLILAAAILSGCAGTARGVKSSVYRHDESLSVVDLSRSPADAMVVIRYPAVVDEDAVRAYQSAFEQHPIGGAVRTDGLSGAETEQIAQSLISKSNYYAMSLFRELGSGLPPQSVLLSPHIVLLDDSGRLVSEPLLSSEEVPSVLTVDFSVYTFPDPRRMMDAEPLTFGDIVTPLFVVHANRWLRPPTHGLLLSSEPLVGAAWVQSERQAETQARNRLDDDIFEFRRPLDFVTFLDEGPGSRSGLPLKRPSASRGDVRSVELHPLEKIRMDPEAVQAMGSDGSVDPFADKFVKGAATRIVDALNPVDHDRATFFGRQIALSRFDPALGEAFLSRSRSQDLQARLQMAEALIAAERKFLSEQSENLYEGIYQGMYGHQMRQMIAAEHRLLEERRDLARAQNLSTAFAVLAMAGAVYIGSNGEGSNFFESSTMENLLVLSSVWAVNSAISKSAQSRTVGENFLVQMAPALNRQVTVQVEWMESAEQISARDFSEFRGKALSLYQSRVRSFGGHVFDPDCAFRHPRVEQAGRWFGLCRDGLGISDGYGLIMDGQGTRIEYVGSAEQGLASGHGAMIFSAPGRAGASYYEGSFVGGLPDGVVLVSEPGRKPRMRRYDAGDDRGPADADRWQGLRF